jgi:hypothetical protein
VRVWTTALTVVREHLDNDDQMAYSLYIWILFDFRQIYSIFIFKLAFITIQKNLRKFILPLFLLYVFRLNSLNVCEFINWIVLPEIYQSSHNHGHLYNADSIQKRSYFRALQPIWKVEDLGALYYCKRGIMSIFSLSTKKTFRFVKSMLFVEWLYGFTVY